ncbi:MAG: NUDIX domain-containing protein [Pseudomonadota bacterium]|nr:NUDIX domain-containing protein [Pseudomonadota bacterium]
MAKKRYFGEQGDVAVRVDGKLFIHRCAYFIVQDGKMLLSYAEEDENPHYFIPGGKVKCGMDTQASVIREILEETGIDVPADNVSMAVHSERFFKHKQTGMQGHEVCTMFRVKLPKGSCVPKRERDGGKFLFCWVPVEELATLNFRESYIFQQVKDISQGIHHVIHREAMDQ